MKLRTLALPVCWALAATACSQFTPDTSEPDLVVVAPYIDEEADQFEAVLAVFETQTGLQVDLIGSGSLAPALDRALADGLAIDVGLIAQPGLISDLVQSETLVPLSDRVQTTIEENHSPAAVALGVYNGESYGVWVRADIKSLVWYSPSVFAENAWEVPTTLDELDALTARIAGTGLAPWCFTVSSFDSTGWPATDWVEDLVLRLTSVEDYDRWVRGDLAFASPQISAAFEQFQTLLTPENLYGGRRRALGASFRESPHDLAAGRCAMLRFGTVALSLFPSTTSIGADGDISAFILPPASGGDPPLLVSGEIAVAFNDRAESQMLLDYLASPRSAEVWAQAGPHLPPHSSFHPESEDDTAANLALLLQEATVFRFDGSDRMPQEIGTNLFWDAMVDIIAGQDLTRVLCDLDAAWANLRTRAGRTPSSQEGNGVCTGTAGPPNGSP